MPSILTSTICFGVLCTVAYSDPWMRSFGVVKNVQDTHDESRSIRAPRIKPNTRNHIEKERDRVTLPANFTTRPPCCSDSITSAVCIKMQRSDPMGFNMRCLADADFSLIQCCSSCGMANADQRYKQFFGLGLASPHCFDRHSADFCDRLREGSGFWQNTRWTCDGDSTPLAFRACRKTCGYCNADIYSTPTGKFVPKACGRRAEFQPNY